MRLDLRIVLIILIGILLSSCEKKIVEDFLVYERTEISIPNVVEITSISFPTIQIGYAITDKGTFKTINGGSSWTNLEVYSTGDISFFDENYGIISTGFATVNGGETWSVLANSESVSITKEGQIVVLKKDSWNKCSLWVSDFKDVNISFKHSFFYIKSDLDRIECHGDHVYLFPKDFITNHLVAYDYESGTDFQITEQYTADERITDLCVFSNNITICGDDGFIGASTVPSDSRFGTVYRTFFSHTNSFSSTDNYNDLVVVVGKNVIATNKVFFSNESDFKDVYQPSLNSFEEDFILVDIIDENNIVTVTADAKIYKGKI
jgi:hypothetical protein